MELFLKAVLLGVIEGITEFLPISSTGHLILANHFIEFSGTFANMFDVVIQLGAILSVIFYFHKRLNPLSKRITPEQRNDIIDTWKKAIIGVFPALVLGFLLGDIVEEQLFNPLTVSIMLVAGGIVLLILESKSKTPSYQSVKELTLKTVLLIGLFQCLAMVPGTSRAAATIIGAMLLGASRGVAAEFSFFLAIPTMAAASGYSLLKHGAMLSPTEWGALAVGFTISFFTAWAVIAFFMNYIRKHNFNLFAWYRIILGAIMLFLIFNQKL
jgi:undecaprenyl-diphosphatase